MAKIMTGVCIFFIFFVLAQSLFADTVYFKNGKILNNAATKEDEKGIWIEGVLFEKQGIAKIEQKPVVKVPPFPRPKESLQKPTTTSVSSSDIDARIKQRAEKEKRNAARATQQTEQSSRETKHQEEYQTPQPVSSFYGSGMKKY